MREKKYSELFKKLKESGWYQTRTIIDKDSFEVYQTTYPKYLLEFINQFGNLEIVSDLVVYNTAEYRSESYHKITTVKQIYKNLYPVYKKGEEIDFSDECQDYYYSTLIGHALHWVCQIEVWVDNIRRGNYSIYMDELNNFYEITDIVDLIWFANNPIDALEQLLFGFTESLTLDDVNLKWLGRNKDSEYSPPINETLTENPWT